MEKLVFTQLTEAVEWFEKLAQTMSYDTALPDSIKKMYGPKIMQDAAQFLNSQPVSSIQINVSYANKAANFEVLSTGAASDKVNAELKALLDRKYGAAVGHLISAKDPKAVDFSFQLFTVE